VKAHLGSYGISAADRLRIRRSRRQWSRERFTRTLIPWLRHFRDGGGAAAGLHAAFTFAATTSQRVSPTRRKGGRHPRQPRGAMGPPYPQTVCHGQAHGPA
jgi:hypothetical protein